MLGLEGDPTPGDPDRTASLAGKLLHQADLAEHNRQRLAAVAAGGGQLGMEGDYAPKFREVLGELPGELAKVGTAYRGAGEALRAFASDLRQEKSRAGTALRQGTDASTRYDGALREIRALLPSGNLQVSPMLGVEASVEQATEGLDETTRTQARAAARRARAAEADKTAARRLADQAARLRADAETRAADGINRALDHSGIKNKSLWEKAWDVVSWPFQSWDNFVSFCKGVAFVVGTIALFVSGPVGWALVGVALAAAAVEFGDTLVKVVQGKASLADLAFAAAGLIPGSAGAIRLAAMGRNLTKVAAGGLRNVRVVPKVLKNTLPDGPRLRYVKQIEGRLTRIADDAIDVVDQGRSTTRWAKKLAKTSPSSPRYAAVRGNAYHDEMFRQIKQAQGKGDLPPNLRTNRGRADVPGARESLRLRGLRNPFSPKRPDIRLPLGKGQEAIWDLTSARQMGHAGGYGNKASVDYLAELLY